MRNPGIAQEWMSRKDKRDNRETHQGPKFRTRLRKEGA
jgi:hypothetical protein